MLTIWQHPTQFMRETSRLLRIKKATMLPYCFVYAVPSFPNSTQIGEYGWAASDASSNSLKKKKKKKKLYLQNNCFPPSSVTRKYYNNF